MTEKQDSSREATRKEILFKQKDRIQSDKGRDFLLATAFILGFFGSASVLMPSTGTPTGMFYADIQPESPEIMNDSIIDYRQENDVISFVYDSRLNNPNVVDATIEKTPYIITVDGETVKRGVKPWETTIPSNKSEFVTYGFKLDLSGLPEGKNFQDGNIRVEGTMKFVSGGETFTESFTKIVN